VPPFSVPCPHTLVTGRTQLHVTKVPRDSSISESGPLPRNVTANPTPLPCTSLVPIYSKPKVQSQSTSLPQEGFATDFLVVAHQWPRRCSAVPPLPAAGDARRRRCGGWSPRRRRPRGPPRGRRRRCRHSSISLAPMPGWPALRSSRGGGRSSARRSSTTTSTR
jgi:hypothetical protein